MNTTLFIFNLKKTTGRIFEVLLYIMVPVMFFSSLLPQNRLWLILIIIISLMGPLNYILLSVYPPEGYLYTGFGGDESVFFTTMESVKWGLTNPWSETDESIFSNPGFGPVYILLPLAAISLLTGIPSFTIFVIFKFFATFLFLLVAYHFIKCFTTHHDKAYTLFALAAGIGGLFIMFYKILTLSDIASPTPLYGFGIPLVRITGVYQLLPFATSLLSMMFAVNGATYRRDTYYVASGIFLGITFLFYPFFGVATVLILLLYYVSNNKYGALSFLRTILISAPFAAIWVAPYVINSKSFQSYAQAGQDISGIFLPTLVLGWGIPFVFALYFIYRQNKQLLQRNNLYIIAWIFSLVLFSLANITRSFWTSTPPIKSILASSGLSNLVNFISPFALIMQIPLFLLILWQSFIMYKQITSPGIKFLFLWLIVVALLVIAPGEFVYLFGGKIHTFIWIPISILGAEGITEFSRNHGINANLLLVMIFILSLPTIFLLTLYGQTYPRSSINSSNTEQCCFFYTTDEAEAFDFLSSQPRGLVFSSLETGTALPANSGQKALLHLYTKNFVSDAKEKMSDSREFFLPETLAKERKNIIEKYEVQYVFLGPSEKRYGLSELNEDFLRKIFENKTVRVYVVQL